MFYLQYMVVPGSVLSAYGISCSEGSIQPIGTGLINHTWKVFAEDKTYVLQRVNDQVFNDPAAIANNIGMVADYLSVHAPAYMFPAPVKTIKGDSIVFEPGKGYYRLYPFVNGSHAKTVVDTSSQAYAAAAQFGRFTRLLSAFDVARLHTILPFFHDLSFRYDEFQQALKNGDAERIFRSTDIVASIISHDHIVHEYLSLISNPECKLRVTHHDTKISNVLFNGDNKALCVIDLDTLMPGYFISDVGDMMRTYLCPVNEEEPDLAKIHIRDDVYRAIVQGYRSEMEGELTATEKGYFFYAGECMIYMQALRFLTDYLNNDIYYGSRYPDQNFVRAGNQLRLLERFIEKRHLYANE